VFGISEISPNSVEGKLATLCGQLRLDPAHWLPSGEVESRRRKIDQVNPFVLGERILVGMSIHNRLDLRHRRDDVEEATAVQQIDLGRVVKAQDGGSLIARAKENLQPGPLRPAQQSRHYVDQVERIKDHESDRTGVDRNDVPVLDGTFHDGRARKRVEEIVAVVVVANAKANRASPADWRQQGLEVVVRFDPAAPPGEIARDDKTIRQIGLDPGNDLPEVPIRIGTPATPIRVTGDVRIGEQRPTRAILSWVAEDATWPQRSDTGREGQAPLEDLTSAQIICASIEHGYHPPYFKQFCSTEE
jgi:hypothetical protein